MRRRLVHSLRRRLPAQWESRRCSQRKVMPKLRIKKVTAADLVADRLKELVLTQEWRVGEKLPSEAALADMFDVNRLTVRVALQRLNALGILETRDGEGTFVKPFDFSVYMANVTDFLTTPALLARIGEFRMVVEGACARLAVERAKDEDLARLVPMGIRFEQCVAKYDARMTPQAIDALHEETLEHTLAIHGEICRLADNPLLSYAFEIAREPIRRYMQINARDRLAVSDESGKNPWVGRHLRLIEALRRRDAETACALLRELILGTDNAGSAQRDGSGGQRP